MVQYRMRTDLVTREEKKTKLSNNKLKTIIFSQLVDHSQIKDLNYKIHQLTTIRMSPKLILRSLLQTRVLSKSKLLVRINKVKILIISPSSMRKRRRVTKRYRKTMFNSQL